MTVRAADKTTLYYISAATGKIADGGDVRATNAVAAKDVQLLAAYGGSVYFSVSDGTTVILYKSNPLSPNVKTNLGSYPAATVRIDPSPDYLSFIAADRSKNISVYYDAASDTLTPPVGTADLIYHDDVIVSPSLGTSYRYNAGTKTLENVTPVTAPVPAVTTDTSAAVSSAKPQ